jgi:uncharacterized repeat protein (TIGR03837 family)
MKIDILCKVVDNLGDAGVCWRLARQLVAEHQAQVRLWVDDLSTLHKIAPNSVACGVEVQHWQEGQAQHFVPQEVLIEAFACGTPLPVAAQITTSKTVWINLEYLSAETWVDEAHGLSSPKANGSLQHFFFPGFTAKTGGLLREREAVLAQPAPPNEVLTVSLFCYPSAPIDGLVQSLAAYNKPVRLLVPEGVCPALGAGGQQGSLTIERVPFTDQAGYDALLRRCDLNFVRGEDSFVRAQWAQKPLIWQIYPQDEGAHLVKLDAFLSRYCAKMPKEMAQTLALLHHLWNGAPRDGVADWHNMLNRLPAFSAQARAWAAELCKMPDLASQLMKFIRERVQ